MARKNKKEEKAACGCDHKIRISIKNLKLY